MVPFSGLHIEPLLEKMKIIIFDLHGMKFFSLLWCHLDFRFFPEFRDNLDFRDLFCAWRVTFCKNFDHLGKKIFLVKYIAIFSFGLTEWLFGKMVIMTFDHLNNGNFLVKKCSRISGYFPAFRDYFTFPGFFWAFRVTFSTFGKMLIITFDYCGETQWFYRGHRQRNRGPNFADFKAVGCS